MELKFAFKYACGWASHPWLWRGTCIIFPGLCDIGLGLNMSSVTRFRLRVKLKSSNNMHDGFRQKVLEWKLRWFRFRLKLKDHDEGSITQNRAVAYPGFPRWVRQPKKWGCEHITWPNVCRKLHENERNWTEREALNPSAPLGSNGAGQNVDSRRTQNYWLTFVFLFIWCKLITKYLWKKNIHQDNWGESS